MDHLDHRTGMKELIVITFVSAAFFFAGLYCMIEYHDVHTISPWLSPREPFVIGRPAAISDMNILEMHAQIDVVVPGSFWTLYSFDIVRNAWCKKYIGFSGVVKKSEAKYADSAVAGVFGSLRKQLLNVSLPSPTNTKENDVCAVIRPIYPTRYDNAPKVNVRVTYRYKKSKESIWCTVLTCVAYLIISMVIVQSYNKPQQYVVPPQPTEQKLPESKTTVLNPPKVHESRKANELSWSEKPKEQDSDEERPKKCDVVHDSNDCDYELIPHANIAFDKYK